MPCAFISGITGQFFRQFAMTIAVSTVISAFNSLTLSPALTALCCGRAANRLRRRSPGSRFRSIGGGLGWFLAADLQPTCWLFGLPTGLARPFAEHWLATTAVLLAAILATAGNP